MTALTTGELVFRTLLVLGATGTFAVAAIGGTWLYAKYKKAAANKTKPRPGTPRHA